MLVKDVFKLKNGRTTFVGPISGGDNFIGPCQCEVSVAGKQLAIIQLEGEMMVEKTVRMDERSLSTMDAVPLDKDQIASGRCALKSM